jgi:hypothetical protein
VTGEAAAEEAAQASLPLVAIDSVYWATGLLPPVPDAFVPPLPQVPGSPGGGFSAGSPRKAAPATAGAAAGAAATAGGAGGTTPSASAQAGAPAAGGAAAAAAAALSDAQLEIPEDSVRAVRVAVGHSHVVVCTRDGGVWGWGLNTFGQVGVGAAGRVRCIERPQQVPLQLFLEAEAEEQNSRANPAAPAFAAAAAAERRKATSAGVAGIGGGGDGYEEHGGSATPLIAEEGRGGGPVGPLPSPPPVPLPTSGMNHLTLHGVDPSLDPAVAVFAGPFHTVVGTAGGALLAWGRNAEGALGHGDTKQTDRPELLQVQVTVKVALDRSGRPAHAAAAAAAARRARVGSSSGAQGAGVGPSSLRSPLAGVAPGTPQAAGTPARGRAPTARGSLQQGAATPGAAPGSPAHGSPESPKPLFLAPQALSGARGSPGSGPASSLSALQLPQAAGVDAAGTAAASGVLPSVLSLQSPTALPLPVLSPDAVSSVTRRALLNRVESGAGPAGSPRLTGDAAGASASPLGARNGAGRSPAGHQLLSSAALKAALPAGAASLAAGNSGTGRGDLTSPTAASTAAPSAAASALATAVVVRVGRPWRRILDIGCGKDFTLVLEAPVPRSAAAAEDDGVGTSRAGVAGRAGVRGASGARGETFRASDLVDLHSPTSRSTHAQAATSTAGPMPARAGRAEGASAAAAAAAAAPMTPQRKHDAESAAEPQARSTSRPTLLQRRRTGSPRSIASAAAGGAGAAFTGATGPSAAAAAGAAAELSLQLTDIEASASAPATQSGAASTADDATLADGGATGTAADDATAASCAPLLTATHGSSLSGLASELEEGLSATRVARNLAANLADTPTHRSGRDRGDAEGASQQQQQQPLAPVTSASAASTPKRRAAREPADERQAALPAAVWAAIAPPSRDGGPAAGGPAGAAYGRGDRAGSFMSSATAFTTGQQSTAAPLFVHSHAAARAAPHGGGSGQHAHPYGAGGGSSSIGSAGPGDAYGASFAAAAAVASLRARIEEEMGRIERGAQERVARRRVEEAQTRALTPEWQRVLESVTGSWEYFQATDVTLQTLWRQGLPPALRGRVWPLAIGNRARVTPAVFEMCKQRARRIQQLLASEAARTAALQQQQMQREQQLQTHAPAPGSPAFGAWGSVTSPQRGRTSTLAAFADGALPGSPAALRGAPGPASPLHGGLGGEHHHPSATSSSLASAAVLSGAGARPYPPHASAAAGSRGQQQPRHGQQQGPQRPPVQAFFLGREDTLPLIATDLPRTFPALQLFGPGETPSEGPFHAHLREVLEAFVAYRPDIGYVQGLSYLAAMLTLAIAGHAVVAAPRRQGTVIVPSPSLAQVNAWGAMQGPAGVASDLALRAGVGGGAGSSAAAAGIGAGTGSSLPGVGGVQEGSVYVTPRYTACTVPIWLPAPPGGKAGAGGGGSGGGGAGTVVVPASLTGVAGTGVSLQLNAPTGAVPLHIAMGVSLPPTMSLEDTQAALRSLAGSAGGTGLGPGGGLQARAAGALAPLHSAFLQARSLFFRNSAGDEVLTAERPPAPPPAPAPPAAGAEGGASAAKGAAAGGGLKPAAASSGGSGGSLFSSFLSTITGGLVGGPSAAAADAAKAAAAAAAAPPAPPPGPPPPDKYRRLAVCATPRALAPLIVADDRYLTFQALANLLTEHHLYVFYALDPGPTAPYYDLFDRLLAVRNERLSRALEAFCIPCEMYLFGWWQTVFLKCLPLAAAARVWDGFLLDGFPHLYRTAAALLDLLTPFILTPDPAYEDAIQLLTQSHVKADVWEAITEPDLLQAAIDAVVLPTDIALELQDLVSDCFFFRHTGPARGAPNPFAGYGGGGGAGGFSTPVKQRGSSSALGIDPRAGAAAGGALSPGYSWGSEPLALPLGAHTWSYGLPAGMLAAHEAGEGPGSSTGAAAGGPGGAGEGGPGHSHGHNHGGHHHHHRGHHDGHAGGHRGQGGAGRPRRASSSSLASSASACGTGGRLALMPQPPPVPPHGGHRTGGAADSKRREH